MNKIENYVDSINNLVSDFDHKYYDNYWFQEVVMENIWMWPFDLWEDFWWIDDIYIALKFNMEKEIVHDWYSYSLDRAMEDKIEWTINLYSYWRMKTLSPEMLEKEWIDDIKLSEEKVSKARKAFEESL